MAKRVIISCISWCEWAMPLANISSQTRRGLVLLDLNWLMLKRSAPGLVCIITPLPQCTKALSRTVSRKRENKVGARTQPCFTPFSTSKLSDSSPFMLTKAFMPLWREAIRSVNRSRQPILRRIFHNVSHVHCIEGFSKVYKYHEERPVLLNALFLYLF